MQPSTISRLATCALGAAVMAGCAAPPSPTAASAQRNVESGKVASIETGVVAGQPETSASSGSSVAGTTASSEPAIITVRFADGTERRYISEQHSPKAFGAGDSVYLVKSTDGDRMALVSASK